MANRPKINGSIVLNEGTKDTIKLNLNNKDFSDFAWDIFCFLRDYQNGVFGIKSTADAMNESFCEFMKNRVKGI
jgi:hypothetical protein